MRSKLLLLPICILLFFSCKSQKKYSKDKNQDNEYFVSEFKNYYIRSCPKEGYNNKEIDYLLREDHSFNSDFLLGIENYRKIDSLSRVTKSLIIKDSLASYQRPEGFQGKRVLSFCLCEYQSKELDSIAKDAYKKYKQQFESMRNR